MESDKPLKPYPLTLLFTLVSLFGIGAAIAISMILITRQERRGLIHEGEIYASQITDHLNHSIHDRLIAELEKRGLSIDLSNPEQFKELDAIVLRAIRGFEVITVNWFDEDGTILYSTKPDFVGSRSDNNEGVSVAFAGQVFSEFKNRGDISDITGKPLDTDLLETYHPIYLLTSDSKKLVAGVLELYQDGTLISEGIVKAREKVATVIVFTLGGLFFLLLFIVRKADRTIKRQTLEIQKQNRNLERLVTEKTSEVVNVQNKLFEASRLVSLGTLAAGVAHEINNPLASVAACAEGLLSRSKDLKIDGNPALSDFPEYLEIIKKESYRCKEVTSRLLNFAKKKPLDRTAVPLSPIFQDIRTLLSYHPKVREGCLAIKPTKEKVVAGSGEIQQILLNLINNAIDALEDVEDGRIEIETTREGSEVLIAVKDNGRGFSSEQKEQIFDLFFTTKSPERGSGIGLALTKTIVENLGGKIEAHSPGKDRGSLFLLKLPRSS